MSTSTFRVGAYCCMLIDAGGAARLYVYVDEN